MAHRKPDPNRRLLAKNQHSQNTPVRVTTYQPDWKDRPKSATDKTNMVYATTLIRPNQLPHNQRFVAGSWAEKLSVRIVIGSNATIAIKFIPIANLIGPTVVPI